MQYNRETTIGIGAVAVGVAALGYYFFGCKKPCGKPKLTYFNGRGLAETSRLILAESGVEWEDKRFGDRSELETMKAAGLLPFGQVPLYEQGSFKLSQSNAIARYLARKHGLAGHTDEEAAVAESIVECIVADLRPALIKINYEKMFSDEQKAQLKTTFLTETLPKFIAIFESVLQKNGGDYICGRNFTYADIALYQFFTTPVWKDAPSVQLGPLLKALVDRVASRPRIAKWVKERPVTDF